MDDIQAIVGIVAMAGIVAGLAFGLRRFLGDREDTWTFAVLRRGSIAHDWPFGVQEEEPFRWHVEALSQTRRGTEGDVRRTSPRAPAPSLPRTAPG